MKIEIIPRDGGCPVMIYDVEKHDCTEKVFYVRQTSGDEHYIPFDAIMTIHVTPAKGKTESDKEVEQE